MNTMDTVCFALNIKHTEKCIVFINFSFLSHLKWFIHNKEKFFSLLLILYNYPKLSIVIWSLGLWFFKYYKDRFNAKCLQIWLSIKLTLVSKVSDVASHFQKVFLPQYHFVWKRTEKSKEEKEIRIMSIFLFLTKNLQNDNQT